MRGFFFFGGGPEVRRAGGIIPGRADWGEIWRDFLVCHREVLQTSMIRHQKFLSVRKPQGRARIRNALSRRQSHHRRVMARPFSGGERKVAVGQRLSGRQISSGKRTAQVRANPDAGMQTWVDPPSNV